MKQIELQDQPRLGVAATFRLTLNGMRHRLGRSIVTLMVITVAIAFMANALSESIVRRELATVAVERLDDLRIAMTWSARISGATANDEIIRRIGRADADAPEVIEAGRVAGIDDDLRPYHETARSAITMLDWIETLDHRTRRSLVDDAQGFGILRDLGDPERWERFEQVVGRHAALRRSADVDAMRRLVSAWPQLERSTDRIREGYAQAASDVATSRGDRSMLEALVDADGAFGDAVRAAGFGLDSETGRRVARDAARRLQIARLEQALRRPEVRRRVAAQLDIVPREVDAVRLWKMLSGRRGAAIYLEAMTEEGLVFEALDADRVVALAALRSEQAALERAAGFGSRDARLTIERRMIWVLFVSMLVCVVGIANAMLMSVTQRFREIATLKCLGALDGYIALTFVMEAAVLGIVGGVAGTVVGLVIGLGRMYGRIGEVLALAMPYRLLAGAGASAALLGVLLAAVATILPALKASRLAPMEAMRVE
ncbi:MAG: hypothetical protein CMJ18_10560 [Phycisphaeraceae bacterium]|nr:hypothetical protein [Phycisphaeraceae bacterium]